MLRRPPRSTLFPTRRSSDLYRGHQGVLHYLVVVAVVEYLDPAEPGGDRKSTRLNSSHSQISYSLFFFLNATAPTEIYPFPYTTLFRSLSRASGSAPLSRRRRRRRIS